MVRLTRLHISTTSIVLILLYVIAGNYTSKKTFCGIKTGGLCAGLAPCTGSVGQGHSGVVKWKLQDTRWGQGQHQGAGHPLWK